MDWSELREQDGLLKILLFGSNGQVGWELRRALAPLGELVIAERATGVVQGDLERLDSLRSAVRQVKPQVIVNAAAFTAVDAAELGHNQRLVRTVNSLAPGLLAAETAQLGGLLVHYSTDYVFDGSGFEPWRETDPTGPLNYYGFTKLEGERLIMGSGCRHLILRTSWVFSGRGRNFLRTMLNAATERDDLRVVNDQWGAPTSAELIADVTARVVHSTQSGDSLLGTYHLAAGGATSWHGYAQFVIETARRFGHPVRVSRDAILPCGTLEYPTPARRPLNSRLCTRRLSDNFGVVLPQWQQGVERIIAELCGK